MKRFVSVITAAFLMFSLTACSGTGNTTTSDNSQGSNTNKVVASPQNEQQASQNQSNQAKQTPAGESSGAKATSNVIAKSGNAVTDKDKQQVLDSLDKELDNVINDSNNMDNVQTSDTEVN